MYVYIYIYIRICMCILVGVTMYLLQFCPQFVVLYYCAATGGQLRSSYYSCVVFVVVLYCIDCKYDVVLLLSRCVI